MHSMESQVRTRPPRQSPVRSTEGRANGPPHNARGRRGLLGGGTEGNERLTVLTGLLLIVLLAGLGITIVRIGQLLWLHLFLGLLLDRARSAQAGQYRLPVRALLHRQPALPRQGGLPCRTSPTRPSSSC